MKSLIEIQMDNNSNLRKAMETAKTTEQAQKVYDKWKKNIKL